MGRRDRVGDKAERPQSGTGRCQRAEQVAPHSHVVGNNQEGCLGSKPSQAQARQHSRVPVPGRYSLILLAVKTRGMGWSSKRNYQSPFLECWQSHPVWDSLPEQWPEGCQGHQGVGSNLKLGQVSWKPPEVRQRHCPLSDSFPHTDTKL